MRVDFPHKIKLSCHDVTKWQHYLLCAIEWFGPDSDRWQSESTFDDMTFLFADEKDAFMFRLKFSERVIANADNTEQQAYI